MTAIPPDWGRVLMMSSAPAGKGTLAAGAAPDKWSDLMCGLPPKASKTTVLMTAKDGVGALKKAQEVAKAYKPAR